MKRVFFISFILVLFSLNCFASKKNASVDLLKEIVIGEEKQTVKQRFFDAGCKVIEFEEKTFSAKENKFTVVDKFYGNMTTVIFYFDNNNRLEYVDISILPKINAKEKSVLSDYNDKLKAYKKIIQNFVKENDDKNFRLCEAKEYPSDKYIENLVYANDFYSLILYTFKDYYIKIFYGKEEL